MDVVDWFLNSGDSSSGGGGVDDSGVFSYAILGVVAILLIAIVFGELEVAG
jgi:hypothetical protein